jgi:hypothetical protein
LTRNHDAAPIADRTVTFKVGSSTLCSAKTNASGVASCTVLGLLIDLGGRARYAAAFAGDADYLPSSGSGNL